MIQSRHQGEQGMAMITVVILVLIITVVLGIIATHLTAQSSSSRKHTARTESIDIAGSGVQAFQQALVAGRNADTASPGQVDGHSIDAASLLAAAAKVGGTNVATNNARYRDIDTNLGGLGTTIRVPGAIAGTNDYWQVVQALAPTAQSPWMTLYVRGWRETSSGATDAAVVKARLKPGSMADYQLLSDVGINLENGARINGRVHSNGGADEWSVADPLGRRITAGSGVSCHTDTPGVSPIISTTAGKIDLPGSSGCELRESTGTFVPLDAARDSVVRMRARPTGNDVFRFEGGTTAGVATAVISATSVRVTYPGRSAQTIVTPSGSSRALVFDRDVNVSGTAATNARLTIAAWSRPGVAQAAPSITITSSVGRSNPANGPRSLGLLAEGDIVVDPTATAYPRDIQAALMATTGGVRLPWKYRTPTRLTTPAAFYPPGRPRLSVLGSIASHSEITMRWSWGASWIGYAERNYLWDAWLAIYPPPYWPATHPWEIVDQSEANADCYGSTGSAAMKGTAQCR